MSGFDFTTAHLDAEFPVRKNLIYFNHAAVAPLPRRVAAAMTAHVENVRERGAADWRAWYATIEHVREKAAGLIGAARTEIAFLPNTSWALNVVAQAFPWKEGDNVVTDDMEFPSNVYPWMMLKKRGVECRFASSRRGRVTAEDIGAELDARTRLVAVSWVAFHNGWVYPLEEIAALAHRRGALLAVDAIQGLGVLPMDVRKSGVDILAADAHKWLLGPEGCTVFYVSENARERVPAIAAGWWNVKAEGSYLDYALDLYLGGRRYEPGTLPTDHIAGLAAAIDLLTEMGQETVRDRILAINEALKDGLRARRWKIATPEPLASGILAAVPPSGDAPKMAKALESFDIIVSPREGAVRFSPHAGNDLGEAERALAVIDAIG